MGAMKPVLFRAGLIPLPCCLLMQLKKRGRQDADVIVRFSLSFQSFNDLAHRSSGRTGKSVLMSNGSVCRIRRGKRSGKRGGPARRLRPGCHQETGPLDEPGRDQPVRLPRQVAGLSVVRWF